MDTEINEVNHASETNEAKPPKKGGKAVKIIAGILLSGCLVASLGLNIYQAVVPNQKQADFIDYILERIAEEENKENEYIEDGYKVGGEYEIRSTTHISDAYKSGDDSQLSAEDKKTLKMASDVLDEVIEDSMNDYEKELAVYQWMVENIGHGSNGVISRPGMNRSAFTPYDVLSSRSAVCVGYATTFRLFMNMLGMDVHIVHNDYHSWDLIQLDGDWYHVDVYSDAHGTMYSNFNMTDSICNQGHSWDESALPEAKSVKYSPAVQNGIEMDSIYDIPAQFKKTLEDNSSSLFCKFKSPITEDQVGMVEFLVQTLEMAMDSLPDANYYMNAAWYLDEQDNYILGLFIRNYNDWDEPDHFDSDSEEAQAIIKAIAEAFEMDPEALGFHGDDGSIPIDDVLYEGIIGGADGPTQTFVKDDGTVVTTWNGGGSAAIP